MIGLNQQIKESYEVVSPTCSTELHLPNAGKHHISLKCIGVCANIYMSFAVLLHEFIGESKVNQEDLWVSIQLALSVNHNNFKLQIVMCPFGTVNILENAH